MGFTFSMHSDRDRLFLFACMLMLCQSGVKQFRALPIGFRMSRIPKAESIPKKRVVCRYCLSRQLILSSLAIIGLCCLLLHFWWVRLPQSILQSVLLLLSGPQCARLSIIAPAGCAERSFTQAWYPALMNPYHEKQLFYESLFCNQSTYSRSISNRAGRSLCN